MRKNRLVDELAAELRNGVRQIARNPGFTAVAVLTLALGIGANTALFSIFNSLILRPLPVRDPEGLALLADGCGPFRFGKKFAAARPSCRWRLRWSTESFDLSERGGQTNPLNGAYVNGRYFDVLGVTAISGRMLAPADDTPAADGTVAVIVTGSGGNASPAPMT